MENLTMKQSIDSAIKEAYATRNTTSITYKNGDVLSFEFVESGAHVERSENLNLYIYLNGVCKQEVRNTAPNVNMLDYALATYDHQRIATQIKKSLKNKRLSAC